MFWSAHARLCRFVVAGNLKGFFDDDAARQHGRLITEQQRHEARLEPTSGSVFRRRGVAYDTAGGTREA